MAGGYGGHMKKGDTKKGTMSRQQLLNSTEETLREKEEYFHSYIANSSDLLLIINFNGVVTFAGPSVERLLGYKPNEIEGTEGYWLVHPDDKSLARKSAETMDTRSGYPNPPIEIRYRHKNGDWRYFETIGTLFVDPREERYLVINGRDVTDRKKAEEDLRERERWFRAYWENASDLLYIVDTSTHLYTHVSPSVERLLGYTVEEFLSSYGEIFHPGDFFRAVETGKKNVETPERTGEIIEVRLRHKDGAWRYFELVGKPIEEVGESKARCIAMNARDITQRKMMEEALRESEERYRLLAENMDDIIWALALPSGRLTYVSPSVDRLLGYTSRELLDRGANAPLTESSARKIEDHMKAVMEAVSRGEHPENFRLEIEYMQKNGSLLLAESNVHVVYDGSGAVTGIQGVSRDIREQKELEEALRTSRSLLSEAMDIANLVHWQLDLEKKEFIFDDSVFVFLGTTAEKEGGYRIAVNEHVKRFVHPDDADRFCAMISEVETDTADVSISKQYETRRIRRDGNLMWVLTQVMAVKDDNGHTIKVHGISQDITQRKATEEALQKSEEQYRLLAENSNDVIWTAALPEGKLMYLSPSAERLLGYTIEEMMKMRPGAMSTPESDVLMKEKIDDAVALSSGEKTDNCRLEIEQIRRDGSTIWVESNIRFIRDKSGVVVGLHGVNRDITDRKHAEEEIRSVRDRLSEAMKLAGLVDFELNFTNDTYIFNDAFYALVGTTAESEGGYIMSFEHFVNRFVSPESRAEVLHELRSDPLRNAPELPPRESHAVRSDGEKRYVVITTGKVEKDHEGNVIGRHLAMQDITQRKMMEEALRKSEERYRLLAEHMTDFLYVGELPSMKCVYTSPSVQRVLGYTVEEIMAMPITALGSEETVSRWNAFTARLIADAPPEGPVTSPPYEWEMIRKDGSTVWLESTVSLIRDKSGSVVAWQSVNRDVADRKKTEEALQKSEEQYRLLAENSSDNIWFIELPSGKTTYSSPSAERLLGYTPEEMMAMPPDKSHTPASAEKVRRHMKEVMAAIEKGEHPEDMNMEVEQIHKNGSIVFMESSIHVVYGPSGVVIGIQGTNRDITERKKAEEEIRVVRDRLSEAMKLAGLVDFELDMVRGEHILNDSFYEFMHTTAEAEGGYRMSYEDYLTRFIPPEDIAGIRRRIALAGMDDVPFSESRIVRRDGEMRHVIVGAGNVFRNAEGQPVLRHTTMLDITERKEAELALARRTEELARSNAELEQFAYIASHDLQEPLRMITSYTELLNKRYSPRFDEDAKEFMAFIVDAASRMKQLINDLLAYSRVGTRRKPPESTDSRTVLDNVLLNLQLALEEASATVTPDPLPTVTVDPVQLGQLLQNLISNAIKFRGAEPPNVHVSAEAQGNEWIFSVRDNGIGIDPQHFDRIFMIFQRLHTRQQYSGTGIGLAVCKKIVDNMGGRIWVESEPGKGTTFFFTVPR